MSGLAVELNDKHRMCLVRGSAVWIAATVDAYAEHARAPPEGTLDPPLRSNPHLEKLASASMHWAAATRACELVGMEVTKPVGMDVFRPRDGLG